MKNGSAPEKANGNDDVRSNSPAREAEFHESFAALSDALALRFGTLHDGLGEPKYNGVLLVEDGRVASVGSSDSAIPAGTRVVDAACVIPGLINAHAHLEMSGEAQTQGVFVLTTPIQRTLIAAENARKALSTRYYVDPRSRQHERHRHRGSRRDRGRPHSRPKRRRGGPRDLHDGRPRRVCRP